MALLRVEQARNSEPDLANSCNDQVHAPASPDRTSIQNDATKPSVS
jgi:hypothetical protein